MSKTGTKAAQSVRPGSRGARARHGTKGTRSRTGNPLPPEEGNVAPCDKTEASILALPAVLPKKRKPLVDMAQQRMGKLVRQGKLVDALTAVVAALVLAIWHSFPSQEALEEWLSQNGAEPNGSTRNLGQRVAKALTNGKDWKDRRQHISRVGQIASAAHHKGLIPEQVPAWVEEGGIRGAQNYYRQNQAAIEGPAYRPPRDKPTQVPGKSQSESKSAPETSLPNFGTHETRTMAKAANLANSVIADFPSAEGNRDASDQETVENLVAASVNGLANAADVRGGVGVNHAQVQASGSTVAINDLRDTMDNEETAGDMRITFALPPVILDKAKANAARAQRDLASYLTEVVTKVLEHPERSEHPKLTLERHAEALPPDALANLGETILRKLHETNVLRITSPHDDEEDGYRDETITSIAAAGPTLVLAIAEKGVDKPQSQPAPQTQRKPILDVDEAWKHLFMTEIKASAPRFEGRDAVTPLLRKVAEKEHLWGKREHIVCVPRSAFEWDRQAMKPKWNRAANRLFATPPRLHPRLVFAPLEGSSGVIYAKLRDSAAVMRFIVAFGGFTLADTTQARESEMEIAMRMAERPSAGPLGLVATEKPRRGPGRPKGSKNGSTKEAQVVQAD